MVVVVDVVVVGVELVVDVVLVVVVDVVDVVVVLVVEVVLVVVVGVAQLGVADDAVEVRFDPSGEPRVQTRLVPAGRGTEKTLICLPGWNRVGWLRFCGFGLNELFVPEVFQTLRDGSGLDSPNILGWFL